MQAYTIEQAANILYVDTRTLRRYDDSGKFVALRHASGRLYYTYDMLQDYLNGSYDPNNTDKYKELPRSPITITVNTSILPRMEGVGNDREIYFELPKSDDYSSEYNILKLERPVRRNETIVTYHIGKFEEGKFISILNWKSLEF